jgi:hypothetical protein
MKKLNENEIKVLTACAQETRDCAGGDFGYADDVVVEGMTERKKNGYISQLVQKGFLMICPDEFRQMNLKKSATKYIDVYGIELY